MNVSEGVLAVDASYNLLDGGLGDNVFAVDRANATLTSGEGFQSYQISQATLQGNYTVVIKGEQPTVTGATQTGALFIDGQGGLQRVMDVSSNSYLTGRYDQNRNALILSSKLAINAKNSTAAVGEAMVIENYYQGFLGITGVPDAPLAPWDALPAPADGQNTILLPLVMGSRASVSVQAANSMAHPIAQTHPEQTARTAPPDMTAAIMLGASFARATPRKILRPLHRAFAIARTEWDVATIRADQALDHLKARVRR